MSGAISIPHELTDRAMCRQQILGRPPKCCGRWSRAEVKEVAWAGTIAGPEFQDRCFGLRQSPYYFRPLVFPLSGLAGEPDCPHGGSSLQVVYVPSLLHCSAAVASTACLQTTRTEGAPHIDIPAGLKREPTEPPYLQPPCFGAEKNQGICARDGRELHRAALRRGVRHAFHGDTLLQGFIGVRSFPKRGDGPVSAWAEQAGIMPDSSGGSSFSWDACSRCFHARFCRAWCGDHPFPFLYLLCTLSI